MKLLINYNISAQAKAKIYENLKKKISTKQLQKSKIILRSFQRLSESLEIIIITISPTYDIDAKLMNYCYNKNDSIYKLKVCLI